MGELGQTRAHSQRAGARVDFSIFASMKLPKRRITRMLPVRPANVLLVLFPALMALSACHKNAPPQVHVDPNGPVEIVIPKQGAYTGAFMDFGDEEDDVTLR
jgi:hypothetical protein